MTEDRNRKRNVQRKLRLTERENNILKQKMKESGDISFQAYAYHMLFEGQITHYDFSYLRELTYEIEKLGINVNQIAKIANTSKEVSPKDVQDLLDQINNIKNEISVTITTAINKRQ